MLSSYLQQPDHLYLLVINRQLPYKLKSQLFLFLCTVFIVTCQKINQPNNIFIMQIILFYRTKGSSRWILVEEHKTWSDAQSYCRQNYTDLASIRNLTENEEIRGLISNSSWIGLFRDTWKWSDGSNVSFTKWHDNQPSWGYEHCVFSHLGKWHDVPCSISFYFACYSGK
uniref:C-type lectin domain-containing protein n=1 Tax=Myripristis murdjan TaxID=586833 RepID=A0A667XP08_9TELE